jgi:hypothetical protein
MTDEDEAFEELALKQGSWQYTSGWRKKQIMETSMTDKDAMKLALAVLKSNDAWGSSIREAKEKAIAALKERVAQPEQEPVAIFNHAHGVHTFRNVNLKGLPDGEYLVFTHPPQRIKPPAWFPAVENILNEYGLQAIDFVADFKAAMKDAEQSQRTEHNFCSRCGKRTPDFITIHTCTPPKENT